MSDLHPAADTGAAAPPPVVDRQPPPRDRGPKFTVTDETSAGKAIAALVLDDDLKLPETPPRQRQREPRSEPPREPAQQAPPAEPDAGADDAPPTGDDDDYQPDDDEGEADPGPPIELPKSWPAEERAHFEKLPPETQRYLAQRESQREAFIAQRAEEASAIKRAGEAARVEAATQAAAFVDGLSRMREMILPEIRQLDQIDWIRLAAEDRPRYDHLMATRNVLVQRAQLVDQAMAEFQQQQAQQRAQQFLVRQEEERKELHRKIPDMADPVRRESIRTALVEYLTGKGFSNDDLALAIDHRVLDVAYDALRWQQHQRARQAAEQKRNNPPASVQRPGTSAAPTSRENAGQARIKQAAQQLGRTHSERDAGKLLSLLM